MTPPPHESNILEHPGQFRDCYLRLRNRVHTFILSRLGGRDGANDLLQDVFLGLLRRLEAGDIIRNAEAYLIAAARNACQNYIARQPRVAGQVVQHQYQIVEKPAADTLAAAERRQRIATALGKLITEQREIVTLRCFEDMTFDAIAAALGEPLQTVVSRYKAGLEKLQILLKERE